MKDPRKVFFGWWMVIVGGILCLWGYGYTAYGFSALFKPISEELGFSRMVTSIAPAITRFEGGIEAPVVGWVSDRHGPRIAVLTGVSMLGIGLLLMYKVNALWAYLLVWAGICSMGADIGLSMPLDVAITNWFVRRRGIAMSIRQVFSGLSGVIALPLIAWLTVTQGWRTACAIGGAVMLVAGLPLARFFIRPRPPEYYGLLPDGASTEAGETTEVIQAGIEYAARAGEVEFTLKQALKTLAFWLLIVSYMFHGALYSVMNVHCIPFLTDRGMDPVVAAATMSIYIFASLPGRFLGGFVADRVRTSLLPFVMVGAYLLQCIGVTIFLFNQQNMPILYLFFVLYGIGMGAAMPITPVIRARYFGRAHFGTIAGVSRAAIMPVAVAGPIIAGWVYDLTGSYATDFTIFAVTLGISALIVAFARPPRHPSQVPDMALNST